WRPWRLPPRRPSVRWLPLRWRRRAPLRPPRRQPPLRLRFDRLLRRPS
ncbi:hypothetical protein Slala05_56740, partial [Streptomyces lavendulae subsp. lavendulae]